VFAMDYPAKIWGNQAMYQTAQAGVIVFTIFLLFVAFYYILKNNSKLKESEHRFVVLFKNNPALICLNRLSDGKFIDANDAFLHFIGYKREEVLGKTAVDLNLWTDLARRTEVRRQMIENGKAMEIKTQWHKKSGELADVVVDAVVIDIGGEKHYLGLIKDITNSKKTELEVEKKVKELENLNRFMVGRELKMVELKNKISELENKK
jgi:PAS domain S-box-containing protein